jgi:CheY-like chemotaxis protein
MSFVFSELFLLRPSGTAIADACIAGDWMRYREIGSGSQAAKRSFQFNEKCNLAGNNGNKSVLLVDDEGSSREVLQIALESWGYIVCVAMDGEEALLLFKRNAPAAVIADVYMPKLDGLSLLQRLKEENPQAAVILCSAHANLQVAIAAIKGGAADLLPKPVDFARLKSLLDQLTEDNERSLESSQKKFETVSPAGPGPRPPELTCNPRDERLHGTFHTPEFQACLSGGRLSAPSSVYQWRKPLVN